MKESESARVEHTTIKGKRPPPQERRCQKDTGTEQQCRAARLRGSEFCFFHDPQIRGHRMAMQELDQLPLGKSQDLHRLLARAVRAVEKNKLTPQQAYAIGWLVQLMLQTLRGVDRERGYHHSKSYGELIRDAYLKLREGKLSEDEEEFGPDEADPSAWDVSE
ncbi:MAG: hypothetical protein ACRD35_02160 [Candidatus Acidiferrales bacterium]